MARWIGVDPEDLVLITEYCGGGFGSKIPHYIEEALVTWCAGQLGRPVKWTAERSESFTTDVHGRDHVTKSVDIFQKPHISLFNGFSILMRVEFNKRSNIGIL